MELAFIARQDRYRHILNVAWLRFTSSSVRVLSDLGQGIYPALFILQLMVSASRYELCFAVVHETRHTRVLGGMACSSRRMRGGNGWIAVTVGIIQLNWNIDRGKQPTRGLGQSSTMDTDPRGSAAYATTTPRENVRYSIRELLLQVSWQAISPHPQLELRFTGSLTVVVYGTTCTGKNILPARRLVLFRPDESHDKMVI